MYSFSLQNFSMHGLLSKSFKRGTWVGWDYIYNYPGMVAILSKYQYLTSMKFHLFTVHALNSTSGNWKKLRSLRWLNWLLLGSRKRNSSVRYEMSFGFLPISQISFVKKITWKSGKSLIVEILISWGGRNKPRAVRGIDNKYTSCSLIIMLQDISQLYRSTCTR